MKWRGKGGRKCYQCCHTYCVQHRVSRFCFIPVTYIPFTYSAAYLLTSTIYLYALEYLYTHFVFFLRKRFSYKEFFLFLYIYFVNIEIYIYKRRIWSTNKSIGKKFDLVRSYITSKSLNL